MQIDVAAAAMIRGEMKYYVHALHDAFGGAGLAQIGLHEFGGALLDVMLDIFEPAAA